MQAGVSLLVSDVMPIYMIIPRYSHNYAQFCQLLNSNLFTHRRILMLLWEATSGTYGPRVYLHHIILPILSYFLCFYFTLHLYNKNTKNIILSYLSDLTLVSGCVGIDNPYSCWLRGFICFLQVGGKYLRYFAASSLPLQGKPTQCSRGSRNWEIKLYFQFFGTFSSVLDFVWYCLPPRGRSGGILLGANKASLDVRKMVISDNAEKFHVHSEVDGFDYALVVVYGATQLVFKSQLVVYKW